MFLLTWVRDDLMHSVEQKRYLFSEWVPIIVNILMPWTEQFLVQRERNWVMLDYPNIRHATGVIAWALLWPASLRTRAKLALTSYMILHCIFLRILLFVVLSTLRFSTQHFYSNILLEFKFEPKYCPVSYFSTPNISFSIDSHATHDSWWNIEIWLFGEMNRSRFSIRATRIRVIFKL